MSALIRWKLAFFLRSELDVVLAEIVHLYVFSSFICYTSDILYLPFLQRLELDISAAYYTFKVRIIFLIVLLLSDLSPTDFWGENTFVSLILFLGS